MPGVSAFIGIVGRYRNKKYRRIFYKEKMERLVFQAIF